MEVPGSGITQASAAACATAAAAVDAVPVASGCSHHLCSNPSHCSMILDPRGNVHFHIFNCFINSYLCRSGRPTIKKWLPKITLRKYQAKDWRIFCDRIMSDLMHGFCDIKWGSPHFWLIPNSCLRSDEVIGQMACGQRLCLWKMQWTLAVLPHLALKWFNIVICQIFILPSSPRGLPVFHFGQSEF